MTPGFGCRGSLWLALLLLFHAASAATADETPKQLWVDYNPSWMVSDQVSVGGDAGYRTSITSSSGFRLVLRPGVDLPCKSVTLKAGIGNFWTFTDLIDDRWEIRPYQGVGWVWPRGPVTFDHLARLEERFDFNTATWNSVNSLRVRYRLRLRHLFAGAGPDRFWRAYGSGEFFRKLAGEEGLQRDQFRATLGLERSFSRLLRVRLQVTWQQSELFFLPSDSIDVIYFRFRVFQNF